MLSMAGTGQGRQGQKTTGQITRNIVVDLITILFIKLCVEICSAFAISISKRSFCRIRSSFSLKFL